MTGKGRGQRVLVLSEASGEPVRCLGMGGGLRMSDVRVYTDVPAWCVRDRKIDDAGAMRVHTYKSSA